jgi:hypothetical protein
MNKNIISLVHVGSIVPGTLLGTPLPANRSLPWSLKISEFYIDFMSLLINARNS